jgi:hypothetical protein
VRTAAPCVRVYVEQKRPRQRLGPGAAIPGRAEFGPNAPPVLIDVVELTRRPQLQASFKAGASISAAGLGGTLGAVVVNGLGATFGLTCAHVAAPWWNDNPFGTRVTVAVPGVPDGEVLGTVETWTAFSVRNENTADAALIRLDSGTTVDNALSSGARVDESTVQDLDLLHAGEVRIRTRRGEVSGLVDSVRNKLTFGFAGRDFEFSNILAYQAAVEEGDSGSSVVLGTDRLLGMHFAGVGGTGPGYCVIGRKILQAFPNYHLRLP